MNAREMELEIITLKTQVNSMNDAIYTLKTGISWLSEAVAKLEDGKLSFEQRVINNVNELRQDANSRDIYMNDMSIALKDETGSLISVDELRTKLDDVITKVEGRNKSAAVKRNMTDVDALRVLTGDMSEMAHKEAAEEMGLTYAQIYSCRLEFTFKHVHKELREAKWVNPWAKK